ncbi:MAG: RND transporter [Gammaproteobacteria bacterium]
MKWLENIPMPLLLAIAVFAALAPFVPEPHLWEKLKLLAAGELTRPLDIFDLLLHGTPLVLVVIRLFAGRQDAPK